MMLGNVLPTLSINEHRNGSLANSIFSGQHFIGNCTAFVSAPNFDYLRCGQFYRAPASIFAQFVCVVIGNSTYKQMRRIHAARIVAMMANTCAFGNRAIVQFVAEAMNQLYLAFNAHLPVTACVRRFRPYPTTVWRILVNPVPEARASGLAFIVILEKTHRLAFDAVSCSVSFLSDIRAVAATAVAIAVWDFLRGMMGLHDDLQSLCQASGLLAQSPGRFCWVRTGVIIAQIGAFLK